MLADPGLLERALANVIVNALDHSPPGGRGCGSSPARPATPSTFASSTAGPASRPTDRERVFLPFQRLGDAGQGEGVGLGLAVAKGFVEAIGGEVEIEDTPGGGLTMVFRLRAAR